MCAHNARVCSFMQLGAEISFLSAFPQESERLYPPLTYLQTMGSRSLQKIKPRGSSITYTVVTVVPMFGS